MYRAGALQGAAATERQGLQHPASRYCVGPPFAGFRRKRRWFLGVGCGWFSVLIDQVGLFYSPYMSFPTMHLI